MSARIELGPMLPLHGGVKAWQSCVDDTNTLVEIAGEMFHIKDGSIAYAPGAAVWEQDKPLPRGTKIILTID